MLFALAATASQARILCLFNALHHTKIQERNEKQNTLIHLFLLSTPGKVGSPKVKDVIARL